MPPPRRAAHAAELSSAWAFAAIACATGCGRTRAVESPEVAPSTEAPAAPDSSGETAGIPTAPDDPPWLTRLVARFSLQPPIATPHDVWRYRGDGGTRTYLVSDRCCEIPGTLFDESGRELGCVGPYSACAKTRVPTTDGATVWHASEWRLESARAVLADPRLRGEEALRACAQLELDTGLPWLCNWKGNLSSGPAESLRRDDAVERPDKPIPDGDPGILGPSLTQGADGAPVPSTLQGALRGGRAHARPGGGPLGSRRRRPGPRGERAAGSGALAPRQARRWRAHQDGRRELLCGRAITQTREYTRGRASVGEPRRTRDRPPERKSAHFSFRQSMVLLERLACPPSARRGEARGA